MIIITDIALKREASFISPIALHHMIQSRAACGSLGDTFTPSIICPNDKSELIQLIGLIGADFYHHGVSNAIDCCSISGDFTSEATTASCHSATSLPIFEDREGRTCQSRTRSSLHVRRWTPSPYSEGGSAPLWSSLPYFMVESMKDTGIIR